MANAGIRTLAPVAIASLRICRNSDEGFIHGTVVAIAVGGFQHHEVGTTGRVGKHGIAQNRHVSRTQVAREDDDPPFSAGLILDGELDARRTENMAGVKEPQFDALRNFADLLIGQGLESTDQGLDVIGLIEGFHQGAALSLEAPVEPFDIAHLDMG